MSTGPSNLPTRELADQSQKFLYTMSLSTGASLITLCLLLNKVSGLYGLLALLTGYHLSPIQLSMYIYSCVALVLTALLAPHIRTQSPLHCLALAWFYVLDSAINLTYTALFSITWFVVLAQHKAGGNLPSSGASGTISDTSGFTTPQHNVSHVDIIASPVAGNNNAVVAGTPSRAPAGTSGNGSLRDAVLAPENMNSLGVVISLWTISLYFCLIMLAYARMVLRQHIAVSGSKTSYTAASSSSHLAENPFAESKPDGRGWKGKLGRVMVSIGRSYWLGSDEDDISWMNGMGRKFRRSEDVLAKVEAPGPLERERRRRSGTGPPLPAETLVQQSPQKGGALSVPLQNLH
jgi:inositol phosphorylceramide synthase regulatory subunit